MRYKSPYRYMPSGSSYSGGIGLPRLVLVEIIQRFDYTDGSVQRRTHTAQAGTFAWASFARGDDWVIVYIGDAHWVGPRERKADGGGIAVNAPKPSHMFGLTEARQYIRSVPGTVRGYPEGMERYENLPEPTAVGAGK